jgi:hypothetical protein
MLSQSVQSKPSFKLSVILRLAALTFFVSAFLGKAQAATNQTPDQICYCFTQNSRESSRNIVYATKTAVKIYGLKNKLTVVAKAPDWTVYTFSEESKLICSSPLNNFTGGFRLALAITGEPVFSPADFTKTGSDKLCATAIDWYKTNEIYADRAFKSYKRDETAGNSPMVVRYAVTRSLGLPKQVAWLMQRFYGCPKNDGLPMVLKYECCDHSKVNKITTDSITHRQFAASEFQVPTHGYRRVNTVIEVLADKSKSTNADEIMSTFGKFEK